MRNDYALAAGGSFSSPARWFSSETQTVWSGSCRNLLSHDDGARQPIRIKANRYAITEPIPATAFEFEGGSEHQSVDEKHFEVKIPAEPACRASSRPQLVVNEDGRPERTRTVDLYRVNSESDKRQNEPE